ncbi:hypothetical protein PU630_03470 [Microbacterium horticulturae]|uniref:Uncharacterized protein n=1 Tax=Microbacterium horticulturae TaxID=3028316 RepID=A0ABY8BZL6_9MICO|nr:hypothetical protein [Microbacterium sp. KACC 23027]WEG09641.1 hypothetical protein PU630_03470 [Microbacterium sp. KACC 23027]
MDPLTGFALTIVLTGASLYALYWVIRKAVAAGIRDVEENRSHVER